jgi:hypothetical protein
MRRVLLIALVGLSLSAARAEAVTAKDIIDLNRAGLGEEVLLALIEVDGSLFTIDADTLKKLKSAGVTDRVIEAMVRSGRTPQAPPPPAFEPQPSQPQVVVIEHERPVVQQVAVPVPVYIPTYVRARRHGHQGQTVLTPFDPSPGFGADAPPPYRQKRAEPVYWGWGGKLRPDAWKPAPATDQRDLPKPDSESGSRVRR